MFDSLSSKLESAFKVLKGHGKITEINVAETFRNSSDLFDYIKLDNIPRTYNDKIDYKALNNLL